MGEQLRDWRKHRDLFVILCTIKCCHLTDQKVSSLRKPESMGSQLHRCENLQLVQNCLCRIFWLTFFVCTPKRGFSSSVSDKESGNFCACMRKNKVRYTRGRGWFSFLCNFTLVRIILFLSCSINIYYSQQLRFLSNWTWR